MYVFVCAGHKYQKGFAICVRKGNRNLQDAVIEEFISFWFKNSLTKSIIFPAAYT